MKKQHKFQVNDRIKVYGNFDDQLICSEAIILSIDRSSFTKDTFWIKTIHGHQFRVWPEQCRRIIKKKKDFVWIAEDSEWNVTNRPLEQRKLEFPDVLKWRRFVSK